MTDQPAMPGDDFDDADATEFGFSAEELAEQAAIYAASIESLKTVIDISPDQVLSYKYGQQVATYNFQAGCQVLVPSSTPRKFIRIILKEDLKLIVDYKDSHWYSFRIAGGQISPTYEEGGEVKDIQTIGIPTVFTQKLGKIQYAE